MSILKTIDEQLDDILHIVVLDTGVNKEYIIGKNRKTPIARARQLFMFYACQYCEASLDLIGKKVNRNHSTVLYSRDKFKNEIFLKKDDLFYFLKVKKSLMIFFNNGEYAVKRINEERLKIKKSQEIIQSLLNKI